MKSADILCWPVSKWGGGEGILGSCSVVEVCGSIM